jgi:hypothetical protein
MSKREGQPALVLARKMTKTCKNQESIMDTMIVYVDDASYALKMLTPLLAPSATRSATRWVVVACPPRITHHASKWVTRSTRESWRGKWTSQVFDVVLPLLQRSGDSVVTQVSRGPLVSLTESLLKEHSGARVLDARRPKLGQDLEPVTQQQPQEHHSAWGYAAAVAGTSALLAAD